MDRDGFPEVVKEACQSCFLGFAFVCFADDCDLGRGPTLAPMKMGDLGPNKEVPMCDRFLPQFAVDVVVSGRLVSHSSLNPNPNAISFSEIVWLDRNGSREGRRFENYLIVAFLRNTVAHELERLLLVEQKLKSVHTYSSSPWPLRALNEEVLSLENERSLLREYIRCRTTCLAAVYDQDLVSANSASENINAYLASPKPSHISSDTEYAALRLTIEHLMAYPQELRWSKLDSDTHNLQVGIPYCHSRLRRIFRDQTLFYHLASFNRYAVFWPRTVLTPFVHTFLSQAVAQFDFLSSEFELKCFSDVESVRNEIVTGSISPIADYFDSGFFDIIEEAYKAHIHPLAKLFGSSGDTTAFEAAFKEYSADLSVSLVQWSKRRLDRTDEDGSILDSLCGFSDRLRFVLRGLFNSEEFGIKFTTSLPLPCPSFYADLVGSLMPMREQLKLVYSWLDPNASNTAAHDHFCGVTLLLKTAISRWGPSCKVDLIFHRVGFFRSSLFLLYSSLRLQILGAIFSARFTALALMKDSDSLTGTLTYPMLLTLFDSEDWSGHRNAFVRLLEDWKIRISEPSLPQEREFSYSLYTDLLVFPHGARFANAVTRTVYPWWKTGTSTTIIAHAANCSTIRALYQEALYCPLASFLELRSEVYTLLSSYTSRFPGYWDALPPYNSPQTQASLKAAAIRQGSRELVENIVTQLCREETGAIPIAIDSRHAVYRPHPEVFFAAKNLFRAIASASDRAQNVQLFPWSRRTLLIPDPLAIDVLYKGLSVPSFFAPAQFQDVCRYYAPYRSEQSAELITLGHGTMFDERRQELSADIKAVPKRKQRRS
ncbi:hypothetical protein CPB83DRAFT_841094 [Crepidotus variabilis]|uniref:Uncharacterized protein n=1 Tax=Crepidotus variabilis TaxID=179855 RepID=A0A9P6JHW4_9AGAR|nr:hypothetical protein CPB83DRAFT_841094 [Crepidotus variabilis]